MKYDLIIVDAFNYIFRHYKKTYTTNELSNIIIDNFLDISKNAAETILVFDPIIVYRTASSGMSLRKQLDSSYKEGRTYPKNFSKICWNVYSYFCIENEYNIKSITSQKYEADDFIENIISLNKDKQTLLLTNDEDWCRSLSDNVVICDSFDINKIFTKDDFIYKYEFIPTEASIALFKAILGDSSDNIKRAISSRQPKLVNTFFDYIKQVGETNLSVDEVIEFFKKIADKKYVFKEEDTILDPEPTVALSLQTCKTDDKVNLIIKNLFLIKSNFNKDDDYHKYITVVSKDSQKAKMLLVSLGRGQKENNLKKFKKLKPLIV